jgi:hypothetical protein
MKKTTIILSAIAFLASSCGNAQPNSEQVQNSNLHSGYIEPNYQDYYHYYISEVYVNDVKMNHDDYRSFFEGKMIVDSVFWDNYEEENRRVGIYESDSLYVHLSSYDLNVLYTKYIEIFSSRYEVKLRDAIFRVGMSIDEIQHIFPETKIKEEYQNYGGKENKYFSKPAYLGLVGMLIKMYDGTFYPCQGLKFQVLEGMVISILVDFRTDGDFN